MGRNLYFLFKFNLPHISYNLLAVKSFTQILSRFKLNGSAMLTNAEPKSLAPAHEKGNHEKISKQSTLKALVALLNLKKIDAMQIVLNNPAFQQISKAMLVDNFNSCKQNGLVHETLCKYPEILTVTDPERKLGEIKKLPYDVNVVAVLMLLSSTNLVKFISSEKMVDKADGKIAILSSLLEINPQTACEYFYQKPFLLNLSNEKIKTKIKTLLEYGVGKENICKDLWVLKYSEELIRNRLDIAKEQKIDTLKTWMVRAQEGAFQTHIQRRSDNKSILGNSSLTEYLSERLECNVELANYMILKQPALKNKNLKKLNELIDFLFNEGFKPHHICRVPKILVHSVETTRKRLKQLEEKEIKIDSLSMLTKSQNQFMQYYEALVKSKNKSKTDT